MNTQLERPPSPPQTVEYRPSWLDRAAGFIGGIGLRQQTEGRPPVEAPPINELLDGYEVPQAAEPVAVGPESEEAGQLVASLQSTPRLERPQFLPGGVAQGDERHNKSVVTISAPQDKPIGLPTRNFVFAPGISDWSGRDGQKTDPSGQLRSSGSIIRQYARTRSPAPPIEGSVTAFVQPNGLTLYSANNEGAHRIAAAQLRGDDMVPVTNLNVVRLKEDVIPVESQVQ